MSFFQICFSTSECNIIQSWTPADRRNKQLNFCCLNVFELANINGKNLLSNFFPNCKGCVFKDLQKAFDTVNHNILLSKLNHYSIREVAFNCFKNLSHRTQYASIINERSEIQKIKLNLSWSIKNSKINHFADDTSLLYASSSLKDINKKINFDLSNLVQWLGVNKIALNFNKIYFNSFG